MLVGQHLPGLSTNRNGSVVALRIDGKKAIRILEVEVRRLPESAVFDQNSRHLDVGNFINQDITILRVEGDQLVNTARSMTVNIVEPPPETSGITAWRADFSQRRQRLRTRCF